MKPPRGLSHDEAALWARVAATVTPLKRSIPPRTGPGDQAKLGGGASEVAAPAPMAKKIKGRVPPMLVPAAPAPVAPAGTGQGLGQGLGPGLASAGHGLDSHWNRRLARSSTEPDFTLDLHGHTLEQAHRRLDDGLLQAKAMGARLVLVITGKPRAAEAADRGDKRGAIRAKILDWLAAGPHGSDIASVRAAQRKHGGEGAIYLVLRRSR